MKAGNPMPVVRKVKENAAQKELPPILWLPSSVVVLLLPALQRIQIQLIFQTHAIGN